METTVDCGFSCADIRKESSVPEMRDCGFAVPQSESAPSETADVEVKAEPEPIPVPGTRKRK